MFYNLSKNTFRKKQWRSEPKGIRRHIGSNVYLIRDHVHELRLDCTQTRYETDKLEQNICFDSFPMEAVQYFHSGGRPLINLKDLFFIVGTVRRHWRLYLLVKHSPEISSRLNLTTHVYHGLPT